MLREFITLFLESKNDAKELIGINVNQLKKQKPDVTPKERQQLAQSGPVFSAETIAFITNLSEGEVFSEDRKRYIKWLATLLEDALAAEDPEENVFTRNDFRNRAGDFADWARAHPDDYLSFKEFYDVLYEVDTWHAIEADDEISIKSDDAVYSWDDGWKIAPVTEEDCDAEGKAMGHCVGSYADMIKSGSTAIFSLRDPNDKPHVTIEVRGNSVMQIKGKQNRPPETPLYKQKVIEWLKTTDYWYVHGDYMSLLDIKELKELFSNYNDIIDFSRLDSKLWKDITPDDITRYIERLYDLGVNPKAITKIMYNNQHNLKIELAFKNSKFPELRIPVIASASRDVLLELASDPSPEVRLALAQYAVARVERQGEFSDIIEKLMIDDDEDVAETAIPRVLHINEMPSWGTVTITKVKSQKQKSKYGFIHYELNEGYNAKHTLDLIAYDDQYNIFVKENGVAGIIRQHTIEQGQITKQSMSLSQLPKIEWNVFHY